MVLSGHINKTIVATLIAAGVQAVGLSGVDGGLLRCTKKEHPSADLGFVGQIIEVNTLIITTLVNQGMTPVISPISLGFDGQIYNVNADEVAGAVAAALPAEILSFISNVPGVLGPDRRPIPWLTAKETEQLIQSGVIRDGMIPKVRAALGVINQGVASARIVNLNGLNAGGGTIFREIE
jgi:acetylglutamate kinase